MDYRPYETYAIEDDSGFWNLTGTESRESDIDTILTPAGNPVRHSSRELIQEIQTELKIESSNTLINRFSIFQLLCQQIDGFSNNESSSFNFDKRNISKILMGDGVFFPMHPPEEVERLYNLEFVSKFLSDTFGDNNFGKYLVSSPENTRGNWGRYDYKGPRFLELRDKIKEMIDLFSTEQKSIMHYATHITNSLLVSVLFAEGKVLAKELALAAFACNQMIPDFFDEDEKSDMLDEIERISGNAATLLLFVQKGVSETQKLIDMGEGIIVEFKSTFRKNLHTNKPDKDIETASLKEIVAFLNTAGGDLIIGVDDKQQIIGLQADIFRDDDSYKTHIANKISERISNQFSTNIKYYFDIVRNGKVLRLRCEKLPNNQYAYLDAEIYVRNESQTVKLSTKEAIEWTTGRQG